MDDSTVVEIPAFFTNKIAKTVTFNGNGITVETAGPTVFISSENISAFRFRTVWTRGYKFVFGRQYVIETKDFNNKIFQIKLSSIYGIRRKAYHEAWSSIFKQLWAHYFSNMLNYYVDLYDVGQEFELAGVKFLTDGISWDKKNKLLWKEISLKNYRSYFMIHHVDNLLQRKSCSFANDWNAYLLQCLLKTIVNQHKMAKA